jgi:hypothetical protein
VGGESSADPPVQRGLHRGRVDRASTRAKVAADGISPHVRSRCSARAAQPAVPIQEVLPAITAPTTSSSTE